MSLIADTKTAAEYVAILQQKLWSMGDHSNDTEITSLISMLESPLFKQLITIQESLQELKHVSRTQPLTTESFEITTSGELILNEAGAFTPENVSDSSTLKLRGQHFAHAASSLPEFSYNNPEFLQSIERAAAGRPVHTVRLFKPENTSLGFSVVGIKNEGIDGELGIFVQDIQPGGIAAQDGQLQEQDQLLAIDGQPLDSTHSETIRIFQRAQGPVEIVVARGQPSTPRFDLQHQQEEAVPSSPRNTEEEVGGGGGGVEPEEEEEEGEEATRSEEEVPPKVDGSEEVPTTEKGDMVLSTDWTQLEVIELINDGTGLGFGIIGGRSTGVVVKTILPGGIADQDGHLRSGDHILQIGDVNVRGMSSEQVALVLRQSGSHVRLVVARSVLEPPAFQLPQAPVIPTHQLEEYMEHFNQVVAMDPSDQEHHLAQLHLQHLQRLQQQQQTMLGSVQVHPQPIELMPDVAEVDVFNVDLMKDSQGLGITIAGYVGGDSTPDEISGIFVKSITEGSAAAVDGRVQVNDQIIEVDGKSLQGFSNHEAVEVLRNTSQMVRLKLVRFRHGPKYDKLQEYLAQANQTVSHPASSPKESTAVSNPTYNLDSKQIELDDIQLVQDDYSGDLLPSVEAAIKSAWEPIVGSDFLVVVAQLSKFKEGGGLGISLEGTVDVEEGVEMRPHHYIRSILPDGPVGLNGQLKSSDELLEVNGRRLLGLNHVDVVDILKDLPQHVRLVCARRKAPQADSFEPQDMQIASTPFMPGVEPESQLTERLVKAKSEMALPTSEAAAPASLNRSKSRSMEPLTGLAMWNPHPVVIELEKGDRGLGFSILDYQDPVNPSETVIVIRSLVPGGVAQMDGRLVPGDRLIFVNNVNVEHATLEEAVQALKGAGRGMVQIGVAKPLPLTTAYDELKQEPQLPASNDPNGISPYPEVLSTALRDQEESMEGQPELSPPDLIMQTERTLAEHQQQIASVPPLELDLSSATLEGADLKSLSSDMAAASHEHSFAQSDSSSEADRSRSFMGRKDSFYESDEEKKKPQKSPRKSKEKLKGEIEKPPAYESAIEPEDLSVVNEAVVFAASSSAVASSPAIPPQAATPNHEPESKDPTQQAANTSSPEHKPGAGPTVVKSSALPLPSYDEAVTAADAPTPSPPPRTSLGNSPVVHPRVTAPIAKLDSTDSDSDQISPYSSEGNLAAKSPSGSKRIPPPIPPKPRGLLRTSLLKYAQEKDAPPPLPANSPPPLPNSPIPPLTPPLRPAPCSPKWDVKNARSGLLHRKSSNSSMTDHVNVTSSDLKTSPGSPRTLASDSPVALGSPDLTRIPQTAERTIQIHKASQHLGLTLEAVDKAVNGCQVKSIAKPSAADQDGRLQTGDFVVSVNNENLRRITNAQARAILRRSSLQGSEVSITYIPAASVSNMTVPASSEPHQSPLLQKLSLSLSEESAPTTSTAPAPSVSPIDVNEKGDAPSSDGKSVSPGQKTLQTDGSPAVGNQAWGPPRPVELVRQQGKTLGISIVGGRVDMFNVSQEHSNAGIFIKHVLADSPAGRNGTLKKGDRILEVNGVDVRNATHDEAVDVIRNSSSPITFVVQSLSYSSCPGDLDSAQLKPVQSSEDTHKGVSTQPSVTSSSPGSTPQQSFDQKGESFEDSEEEDEFGYTKKRILRKYADLPGLIQLVDLERGNAGMGLGLAGNKDRSKMSVFVAGIQPDSPAARDGRISVGDELLEVNGINLHGLSHLNASATIKGVTTPTVKLVTHRREDFLDHMAVKPLRYGGSSQFDAQSVPPVDSSSQAGNRRESKDSSHSNASGGDTVQVIRLQKQGTQSLGFGIQEETKNGRQGIYVKNIATGSLADKDHQLEVGDEIMEVCDHILTGVHYDKAYDILRTVQGSVRLKVRKASQGTITINNSTNPNLPQGHIQLLNTVDESSTDPQAPEEEIDPRTCPIVLGRRTAIEIEKGKTGLGLSIVGGSDTLLGAIIIHEVYEDGAAARDGRLWAGDQILEVNGEDLTDATHNRALQVLRQTPSVVKMAVYRDESQVREEDILDVFSVDLVKRPGKGLGLSIVGKKNDVGIYISDIVKGGVSEADGRLMQGDQILAVNGEDMRNSTQEYAATVLKTLMGKVNLTVGRLKAGSKASSRKNSSHGTSLKKSDSSASNKSKGRHSKSASASEDPNHLRIVELEQNAAGSLGISVAGGLCSPIGDAPVIIASLSPLGPAARSGKLKAGDKILVINGISTEGMTHEQVISTLKASKKVTLHVVQGEATAVSVSAPRSRQVSADMSEMTVKDVNIDFEDDGQPPQFKTITLNRGPEGLGFSIVGGHGSPHGNLPIYVKTVFNKGAAADEGSLMKGDQILSVNGQSLEGFTHEEAVTILKNTLGVVTLGILS